MTKMIILLTGPTGTGKTDTAWALLREIPEIVFLECDWFASRVPFDWKSTADLESVFQALSIMIDFHVKRNRELFVITLTLEMAATLERYQHYFSDCGLPMRMFRLRCDDDELENRINSRDRIEEQKQEELSVMLNHQREFDALFPNDDVFQLIDTTHLTEGEAAAVIRSTFGSTE